VRNEPNMRIQDNLPIYSTAGVGIGL